MISKHELLNLSPNVMRSCVSEYLSDYPNIREMFADFVCSYCEHVFAIINYAKCYVRNTRCVRVESRTHQQELRVVDEP